MEKSVPECGYYARLIWALRQWTMGRFQERDWEEPQTEGKYRRWCLLGTNSYFRREVAVDSMREKIKHCVEQVVLSDQNMAQGTGGNTCLSCADPNYPGVWRGTNKIH